MTPSLPPEGRVLCEKRGHVLLIGFDRVPKRNALSRAMMIQLGEAYDRLERDADIRVGLLHAFGDHFTAGLQLNEFQDLLEDGRHLSPAGMIDPYDLFPPLRSKPVVAAMQGICFTIAIELMLAADIVIAAEDCRFAQVEVKRGIMANHGATIRFVERAGWGNAMRYLLTGDEFDAQTACRLGLVQQVVAPGRQFDQAFAIAERIAAQAPLAVSATIVNARKAACLGHAAAVLDLGPAQQKLLASRDAAEGLASFLERREAKFEGQ